jgi:hypothetical protein
MKLKRGIAISIVLLGLAAIGALIYGVGYGLASYGPYAALYVGGAFIITGLLTGPLAWNLNHRQKLEWAAVPERKAQLAPKPATVVELPMPAPPEPDPMYALTSIYRKWGVRKQQDGRYSVLPLIDGVPRWEAAILTNCDSTDIAWDVAIEATRRAGYAQLETR